MLLFTLGVIVSVSLSVSERLGLVRLRCQHRTPYILKLRGLVQVLSSNFIFGNNNWVKAIILPVKNLKLLLMCHSLS